MREPEDSFLIRDGLVWLSAAAAACLTCDLRPPSLAPRTPTHPNAAHSMRPDFTLKIHYLALVYELKRAASVCRSGSCACGLRDVYARRGRSMRMATLQGHLLTASKRCATDILDFAREYSCPDKLAYIRER